MFDKLKLSSRSVFGVALLSVSNKIPYLADAEDIYKLVHTEWKLTVRPQDVPHPCAE